MTEEVIDEAALFAQMSADKGDRLSSLINPEHEDTTAAPVTDAAPATETTPAATPAADTTTTTSAQPAPVAAAAPAAAAPTTDIWANASPELRAAHEAALALADQRYKSDIGRQAAHQRQIQLLREENEALRTGKPAAAATASPAPTTDTTPAPVPAAATPAARKSLLDSPEVKKAREEYPEAVEPFAQIIDKLEDRLDAIQRDQNLTREDRATQTIAVQEAALTAAHSDWREACGSKDFADWLAVQPKAIKEIVQRNGEHVVDAEEAIAMVSSFKAHWHLTHPTPQPVATAPAAVPQPTSLQARREAQLQAVTKTPTGGPAPIPDGPGEGSGDDALFKHFAAKKAGNRK